MSVIQGNAIESGLAAYEIPNSLRFNSADSAYLSWTPASAGSLTTWTYSVWVKRTAIGAGQRLFFAWQGTSGTIQTHVMFQSNDTILFEVYNDPTDYKLITTQVFRDPSSWYHIVAVYDSTNATSGDRMRLYVNGSRITAFGTAAYPSQNYQGLVNSTNVHNIGRRGDTGVEYFNGYMTEINHVDGQALDPTSFGEYNSETGVWQPKAYAGTYGTNGFYLPMTQDQIVEGFNTVLWRGNGGTQRITGVGFNPDLIWIKNRDSSDPDQSYHNIFDSVRGINARLYPNATNAEESGYLTSFDADGFTMTTSNPNANANGVRYVGWCWDAGNSTVSNTDGTIASSVRASQTYGFSVVTYTGTGSNATIGHGLGVAPKMVILKRRDSSSGGGSDWPTWHTALTGDQYLSLSGSGGYGTLSSVWNGSVPTSSVFSTGTAIPAGSYVAYCFAETGYSKFGSYTGNGSSTGPTVTLGWKPAMVLIKSSSVGGGGYNWRIFDATRDGDDVSDYTLTPNGSYAENTDEYGSFSGPFIRYTDTGFQLVTSGAAINQSGATYIYAAFKDQREAAFWRDFSGNGNHWQPNNLDFNDSVVDVPTNYGTDTGAGGEVRGNYCTFNPIDPGTTATLSNGNLQVSASSSTVGNSNWQIPAGKWFAEFNITTAPSSGWAYIGTGSSTALYVYRSSNGDFYNNSGYVSYGASYTTGDVIGVAVDTTSGTLEYFKNGTSQGQLTGLSFGNAVFTVAPTTAGVLGTVNANFGQLPFAYAAPTGFKALCTTNLPDPAIADGGNYFNAVLYAGTSPSTNSVTGVGFQPDLVWVKSRTSGTRWHENYDVLRPNKKLSSNATDAEYTENMTFDADGFTTSGGVGPNETGNNYVGWCWKAGGTGVSNTDGTITSTVSANPTAGFSIVTYTGTGSAATVGHGLGVAPSFMIVKGRDASSATDWGTYHRSLAPNQVLYLSKTSAVETANNVWNNTAPTSSVFSVVDWIGSNRSGGTFVCYCFAPVSGYSAFGSYVGNGSDDGPFVYTGFRPRYLMWKNATTAGNAWIIWDTARNPYNLSKTILAADQSIADYDATSVSPGFPCDILSNGFKLRGSRDTGNNSGATFIYAAFAENPFKYSLAR